MKQFAVVQHTYAEFLGLIENQLEKRDIGFAYFRPFVGQELPGSAGQFDALFILGAQNPPTDHENAPWHDDELKLIGLFREARRPFVGIGYGAQLLAEYEGGRPSAEPFHNAYWTVAHKTPAGAGDAVADALDGRPVLVMANGSVALPSGIEPLVVDDEGRWLVIRPDALAYGLLCRPELKPGMIEDMIMEAHRDTPPDIGALLEAARHHWQDMQVTTDKLIVALVRELNLMTERRKMPVFRLNISE
ncbi:MAG: GMP synthase [Gammaproteobacteria bacterium]|nr:GMP synthase [Gammaproteobacteria bacterium]